MGPISGEGLHTAKCMVTKNSAFLVGYKMTPVWLLVY